MSIHGIGTVARQEFRLRIRAGRWRWLLSIWFAILLLFTALLRGALGGFTQENVVDKGIVIYGGLMLFVLGLALLVVPALAAQSVNGDRERGTLATLQVTRLSAGDICLGKFTAAWGTALVFLALSLPLVGYAVTQKGVPVGRVVSVTIVLSLLLGTVCAVSLALSALLSRTTTSGVLAYLAVFTLTIGTLISFGLATAITTEKYTETYDNACPSLPPGTSQEQRDAILANCGTPQTYEASRARTDRTWWLLAPNPFVILADAAPQLPPLSEAEKRRRAEGRDHVQDARDLDPLGGIGRAVRDLRTPPDAARSTISYSSTAGGEVYSSQSLTPAKRVERKPVWPWGLAFDVLLAIGALALTTRRLSTPSRHLPKGQRVA